MQHKKILYFIISLFISLSVNELIYSQEQSGNEMLNIDSLKELYLENWQVQPFLATQYAAQALQLALEQNDSLEIATIYGFLGNSYFYQESYSLALDHFFKSFKIYKKMNKQQQLAYSYIDIGSVYFARNLSSISLGYFIKAKEIFEILKDKKGLALVYDKIGHVHLKQSEGKEALEYFINSHYYRKSARDTILIAVSNKNIAEVYFQWEEYEKAISFLKEALISFKSLNKNIEIAEVDDKIGDIYSYKIEYKNAINHYKNSLSIYLKLDKLHNASKLYNKLSKINFEQGKIDDAKNNASKALKIANENDYLDVKSESYVLLSIYYEKKKKIKQAFEFQKMYSLVMDSIVEENNINQSSEMQVSFEIQQQENEIQILTKETELSQATIAKQRIFTSAIGIGAVLLFIFVFFLYKSNQHKQKTNKLLYEQKAKIEKINKNITGSISYASRIQKAMLPKTDIFNEYFKEAFVYFNPKEEVSGDFYWITKKEKEQKIVVAAVDCTGHGVPGAFMSLIGNSYLNQIVNQQNVLEADEILNLLHINIRTELNQEKNQSRDGMDLALCVIDKKNKTIEYSGARNPIFIINENELLQFRGDNMDIGGVQREAERKFTKQIIPYTENTKLYMFSDGFQDQFGGIDKQKFMRKRFKDLLLKISKFKMSEQKEILDQKYEEWRDIGDGSGKKLDQIDDVLVIGLQL
ncbi:MAG: tetratricopeptide repeat protein [Bacteroidales bacterium]|nr:tetratricopeptide repeat protein [Bacteroidales bacterium]MBN2755627.1 tetratricopeptide repeat protein [Bacteroidales bacterium]